MKENTDPWPEGKPMLQTGAGPNPVGRFRIIKNREAEKEFNKKWTEELLFSLNRDIYFEEPNE